MVLLVAFAMFAAVVVARLVTIVTLVRDPTLGRLEAFSLLCACETARKGGVMRAIALN